MRSFASADGARRLSDAATDVSHRCASIVPGRRVDSSRFLLVVGRRLDSEQEPVRRGSSHVDPGRAGRSGLRRAGQRSVWRARMPRGHEREQQARAVGSAPETTAVRLVSLKSTSLRVSSNERVRRAAGNFRCDDSAAYFTKAPE